MSGIGDLFQGIGDFASASGYAGESAAYGQAAKYAQQNAIISQEAGDIKEAQASRAIYKTIGAQKAEFAGAGLTGGGSAQEVLRASVSQGALEKAIINEQTQINVTGYKEQAAEFQGMQAAADAASTASTINGVGSILGFVGSLFGL